MTAWGVGPTMEPIEFGHNVNSSADYSRSLRAKFSGQQSMSAAANVIAALPPGWRLIRINWNKGVKIHVTDPHGRKQIFTKSS
jgi:hypothetical protein